MEFRHTHSRSEADRTANLVLVYWSGQQGKREDLQIGTETHEERREGRNSSCSGNSITLDSRNTQTIVIIWHTQPGIIEGVAHASTAGFGDDGGVHGNNVGHGKEGGKASSDLREKERALALARLIDPSISIKYHDCERLPRATYMT